MGQKSKGNLPSFVRFCHHGGIDDFVAVDSDIWFGMIPFDFSQPQRFAFDAISFVAGGEIAIDDTAPYDPNTPPTPVTNRGKWTLTADGTPTAISAPASLGLLALGITTLPVILRRRRRGATARQAVPLAGKGIARFTA